MREVLTALFLLAGSLIMLLAGLGLIRFPDLFLRMQAATKASTLGLGLVLAAVNFFNLLPIYPLDGGKLVQLLVVSFAPKRLRQANLALTVFALGLALLTRSYFLLFFVMMGWQGLQRSESLLRRQRPMSQRRALLCLAAYLATATAFALGGWAMIQHFA